MAGTFSVALALLGTAISHLRQGLVFYPDSAACAGLTEMVIAIKNSLAGKTFDLGQIPRKMSTLTPALV
jgi:hypothetical protein